MKRKASITRPAVSVNDRKKVDRSRLAGECAKLNSRAEQAMAEEGVGDDLSQWPKY